MTPLPEARIAVVCDGHRKPWRLTTFRRIGGTTANPSLFARWEELPIFTAQVAAVLNYREREGRLPSLSDDPEQVQAVDDVARLPDGLTTERGDFGQGNKPGAAVTRPRTRADGTPDPVGVAVRYDLRCRKCEHAGRSRPLYVTGKRLTRLLDAVIATGAESVTLAQLVALNGRLGNEGRRR